MISGFTVARALATVVLAATSIVSGTPSARWQESSLRAERTVDYKPGQAATLGAKVGAVNIQTVEFSERRGAASFSTRIPAGSGSDTTTAIRAHILAENPTGADWEVTFTLEFLDKDGQLIDHASKKSSWEGEAKAIDVDHPLLTYVVPLIDKVRIRMEAKLD